MPSGKQRIPLESSRFYYFLLDFPRDFKLFCQRKGLFLQFDQRYSLPATILGFKANRFNQGMRFQEFGETTAQSSGAVAVDDADLRRAGKRGLIEKFVHSARAFFDGAADQINFLAGGFGGGLSANSDALRED